MRITEIEIDDRNEAHLTSHGVSIVEVQQVFAKTCGETARAGLGRT